jgi:hypothetical protein
MKTLSPESDGPNIQTLCPVRVVNPTETGGRLLVIPGKRNIIALNKIDYALGRFFTEWKTNNLIGKHVRGETKRSTIHGIH